MNQAYQILENIKLMLVEKGFKQKVIANQYRSEMNYVYNGLFCIPRYVESLGFLIEYADSYEVAMNHGHEDGDSFPISMGEKDILLYLEKELENNIEWHSGIDGE